MPEKPNQPLTSGRIDAAAKAAANLTEVLDKPFKENTALLAEMDPENILHLAGLGVMRLTLAGLTERGFEAAVQMMLLDRNTSLDEVLAFLEKQKAKPK